MQAAECGQRARKIRRIAGNILDLRAIQKTDGGDRECRNGAVGQPDGIFECQDVTAGSASIGGRSAIVECKRRRARDGHRFAQRERECNCVSRQRGPG